MWLSFFLRAPIATARTLAREHASNLINYPGLLSRVRDCLPSDRARLSFDLLVVELALEWELVIEQGYIDRANDVSPLIVRGLKHP